LVLDRESRPYAWTQAEIIRQESERPFGGDGISYDLHVIGRTELGEVTNRDRQFADSYFCDADR